MTVYELMTGKVPYQHIKNSATVIFAISRGELPSDPKQNEVRHDWDPQLLDLMHRCWETRPGLRPSMSAVSSCVRSIRENRPCVPQSLILAIDTPLSPVSPNSVILVEEDQVDIKDATFVIESPLSEGASVAYSNRQLTFDFKLAPPPIPPTPPPKKLPAKRKSTAGESTVSRGESKDGLADLPDLRSNLTSRTARPRSSSAPMAIPIRIGSRELSSSPTPASVAFRSLNSSQVSLGTMSGQSRFSKPSRPVTPATPVPDEPSSSSPSSPVATRKQRISSFWKKNSLERAPPEALVTADPLKTVQPLLRLLVEGQEGMLNNTYDATFSSRLRKVGPALVPLDRIDGLVTSLLGGYVRLRKQHSIFLRSLKSAETMTALDFVHVISDLLSETIDAFTPVYPNYALGIYAVEEVLAEEMERNFPFRAWLQVCLSLSCPFKEFDGVAGI